MNKKEHIPINIQSLTQSTQIIEGWSNDNKYYNLDNEHFFSILPEGASIKCNNENNGVVYRYTNNTRRHYPNPDIARS